MPGQKGNKGGAKGRSGRKSKAEEAGLAALIDECWPDSEKKVVFRKLIAEAKKGVIPAAQLLLHYRYGKPAERHEHRGEGGGPVIFKVVYGK